MCFLLSPSHQRHSKFLLGSYIAQYVLLLGCVCCGTFPSAKAYFSSLNGELDLNSFHGQIASILVLYWKVSFLQTQKVNGTIHASRGLQDQAVIL